MSRTTQPPGRPGFRIIWIICWIIAYVAMTASTMDIRLALVVPSSPDKMFAISKILPALKISTESDNFTELLPDTNITFLTRDSECNSVAAPIAGFDLIRDHHVQGFLGPVCDYSLAPLARYAPYWDTFVITPGGFAHDFMTKSEYPTLTRLGATFEGLSRAIINSVKNYNWTKIKLVYDSFGLENVTPRFCYLAMSALAVYAYKLGLKQEDVHPFLFNGSIPEPDRSRLFEKLLTEEVGNKYSSKSYTYYMYNCMYCLLSFDFPMTRVSTWRFGDVALMFLIVKPLENGYAGL